jgi:hypothetical protein
MPQKQLYIIEDTKSIKRKCGPIYKKNLKKENIRDMKSMYNPMMKQPFSS